MPAFALAFASEPGATWTVLDHGRALDLGLALGQASTAAVALFAAMLAVRAWLVRGRYRTSGLLTPLDLDVLRREVGKAERKTEGEISVVVLEAADPHAAATWRAGAFALVLAAALGARVLPWDAPFRSTLLLLLAGGAGALVARALPDLRRRFLTEREATLAAERRAREEFYALRLHRAADGAGVLVLVTLFEHRVVVLGGEGIAQRSGPDLWKRANYSILEGVRRESLRIGLAEAVRRVAEILQTEFPWQDRNRPEIPGRVVVRRR